MGLVPRGYDQAMRWTEPPAMAWISFWLDAPAQFLLLFVVLPDSFRSWRMTAE
jgi:hypothetical protein